MCKISVYFYDDGTTVLSRDNEKGIPEFFGPFNDQAAAEKEAIRLRWGEAPTTRRVAHKIEEKSLCYEMHDLGDLIAGKGTPSSFAGRLFVKALNAR